MAEKVLMLALSPTMESGTIVDWLKSKGDEVSTGDVLCEVETDKATMEYESVQEGTLLEILVPEGEAAEVEQPIAIIGDEGEDVSDLVKEAQQETQQKARSAAAEGAGDDGPETRPSEGTETPAAAAEDGEAAESGSSAATEAPADVSPEAPVVGGRRIKASPLARVIAKQNGIDISAIDGSGPEGRVVKRDVEQAIESGTHGAGTAGVGTPAAGTGAAAAPLVDEEIPISNKRRVIAQRLSESKFTAPHFYLTLSVFTEGMMAARSALNKRVESKVSVNAFLMKFAAEAVKRHPAVNSSWQGDTIRRFGSIDIGLAVAQKDGLITPIVRDCGSKGILAIDAELSELIRRARDNKLQPEEFTGATFSISSLGTFGIEEFTAIVNPPGSAILAVGKMMKVPVVGQNDQIEARQQMKLTLSCDHRVIDGAQGAEFLEELKGIIEQPVRALY